MFECKTHNVIPRVSIRMISRQDNQLLEVDRNVTACFYGLVLRFSTAIATLV